jgi:hypothetical protein
VKFDQITSPRLATSFGSISLDDLEQEPFATSPPLYYALTAQPLPHPASFPAIALPPLSTASDQTGLATHGHYAALLPIRVRRLCSV